MDATKIEKKTEPEIVLRYRRYKPVVSQLLQTVRIDAEASEILLDLYKQTLLPITQIVSLIIKQAAPYVKMEEVKD